MPSPIPTNFPVESRVSSSWTAASMVHSILPAIAFSDGLLGGGKGHEFVGVLLDQLQVEVVAHPEGRVKDAHVHPVAVHVVQEPLGILVGLQVGHEPRQVLVLDLLGVIQAQFLEFRARPRAAAHAHGCQ